MNENVTNKTLKRRRWIARLLVSALCILLASSLLFVSVVAENVNTYTFELIDQSSSDTHSFYGYFYGSNGFFGLSELVMTPSGFYFYGTSYLYENSYFSPLFQLEYSGNFGTNFAILSVGSSSLGYWVLYSYGSTYYAECFNWSGFRTVSASTEGAFYTTSQNSNRYFCYFSLDGYAFSGGINDSTFVYSNGVKTNVDGYYNCLIYGDGSYFALSSNSSDFAFDLADYSFCSNAQSFGVSTTYYSRSFGDTLCLYYPGNLGIGKFNRVFSIDDGVLSYSSASGSFVSNLAYNLCFLGNVSGNGFSDTEIGRGWSFVRTGDPLSSYKIGLIYATSSEYVPPESSDEITTEPPPESSEESSEPDVTMTKIWKYEPGSDGTSVSTAIGEVDLNDAVKVEAFLGRFESSPDNSNWTDAYQNLMLRVTNSDDTEDIYQFDFPAFGYYSGSLSSEVEFSDFVFPGFVGYWFEIPFENGSEISFATKSPGGSVFLYGYNMQLTVNFNSPDSSFRLLFGQDSYSVVLSNIGENSQIVVFEDETVLRYKKFTVNGGSSWYAPEEGTFALFPASDVLDPNILLSSIRIETNVDNTLGFPTESFLESVSKWEEYLSRQEDKQDFLNSLAGDAYDQISIDPDTSEAYGDAVDTFSTIVNSEGGSVIFGFFRYMWSVHPMMSSMVSLVVSFAIVGFIVRKV